MSTCPNCGRVHQHLGTRTMTIPAVPGVLHSRTVRDRLCGPCDADLPHTDDWS